MKAIIKIVTLTMLLVCNHAIAQQSVAFFYGKQVPLPDICFYDNVIVDPYSNFDPKETCDASSQAFAYVSVGEVDQNVSYAKDIHPDWIIGRNKAWNNNFVIDQNNSQWQQFFINAIITPLWERGYRGFFLDTLDSYFLATFDIAAQEKQINSIVSLIKKIKIKYPEAKIIINRGFQLLPKIHADIDAVVIESLYKAWNQNKQQYETTPLAEQEKLLTEIDNIKKMKLPIIVIDYLPPEQAKEALILSNKIAQQGINPWITNNSLDKIYIKKTYHVHREILIVFNDTENLSARYSSAFSFLGPLIEYMGYIPRYIHLNEIKKSPKDHVASQYVGIILWLDGVHASNTSILNWVKTQINNHIPVIFLNNFGVPVDSPILNDFGLLTTPIKNSDKALQITKMNTKYIGLEMKPLTSPYEFFPLRAHASDVLLQMKNEYKQTEDVVAITPWGGYALIPNVIFYLPNDHTLWVLNPFAFLQRALRLSDSPVPVVTTENGRRLMTVHIDGDGFAYPANWLGGTFAGKELLENILKQYRIPTSVSVITGEIAPNGMHPKKSPELMQAARDIFSLPWVEIASHSLSHPFYWQESTYKNFETLFTGEPFHLDVPNYKFNLHSEIVGSVNFINSYLAPPNKKCHLFFWSGMADPSPEALKIVNDNNLLNINGGNETNISDQYPSLTGIRQMGLSVGGYYQVFAPIDMDFYYMNSLSGPLYGFEHVIQTLQLTDQPRRFKPIDLYYHVYSASFEASLQALHKVYRWALSQPVMNVFISDYIKKVLDYYKIIIAKKDNAWVFYSNQELRELRSPKAFGFPDLLNSKNVIGFQENKEYLYIHLGKNRLTVLEYQQKKPSEPYLVDANARVIGFSRKDNQVIIEFKGYRPLQFTLANVDTCKVLMKNQLKAIRKSGNMVSYSSNRESDEIRINC